MKSPASHLFYATAVIPYGVDVAVERARRTRYATEETPYERAPDFPGHTVDVWWGGLHYGVRRMYVDEMPARFERLEDALAAALVEYKAGTPGAQVIVNPSEADKNHPALAAPGWSREPEEYPWYTWRHARAGTALRAGAEAIAALSDPNVTEAEFCRLYRQET